jgi:hypothetical protein
MTKNEDLDYSLKVWLSTVFISPAIIQLLNLIANPGPITIDLVFPYIIGLVISAPYFLIFIFMVIYSKKISSRTIIRKTIIVGINFLIVSSIFMFLWGDLFWQDIDLIVIFLLITSLSIIVCRLRSNS